MRKRPTMERLGLPLSKDAREEALRDYALRVTQRVEDILGGSEADGAAHVIQMAKHIRWISREEEKAFDNGASVEDCAKWIVKNLNDPRLKI